MKCGRSGSALTTLSSLICSRTGTLARQHWAEPKDGDGQECPSYSQEPTPSSRVSSTESRYETVGLAEETDITYYNSRIILDKNNRRNN